MFGEVNVEMVKSSPHVESKQACSVIDLFCGVGGITHGFVLEGFKVTAGLDADESCCYAYENNNKGAQFVKADLSNPDSEMIAKLYPSDSKIKILIGCAPCQPFSTNNSKRTKVDTDDKWLLVSRFADVIQAVQPHVISMENVPNLKSFKKAQIYTEFIQRLESMGYKVSGSVVACSDYGVPQHRKRLVVLASRLGPIHMLPKQNIDFDELTVRGVIEKLSAIQAGETFPDDPLHKARGLHPQNLERIRQSIPGGTWNDWDERLVADCHKRTVAEPIKVFMVV